MVSLSTEENFLKNIYLSKKLISYFKLVLKTNKIWSNLALRTPTTVNSLFLTVCFVPGEIKPSNIFISKFNRLNMDTSFPCRIRCSLGLLHNPPQHFTFPTFLSGEKLWLHSIKLRRRFWPVNTLTSSAPIGCPIICMWALADICEQLEGNLTACFSRHSWGRNPWRTPKNLCVGGYVDTPLIRTLCLASPVSILMGFDCKNVKKINELRTRPKRCPRL